MLTEHVSPFLSDAFKGAKTIRGKAGLGIGVALLGGLGLIGIAAGIGGHAMVGSSLPASVVGAAARATLPSSQSPGSASIGPPPVDAPAPSPIPTSTPEVPAPLAAAAPPSHVEVANQEPEPAATVTSSETITTSSLGRDPLRPAMEPAGEASSVSLVTAVAAVEITGILVMGILRHMRN